MKFFFLYIFLFLYTFSRLEVDWIGEIFPLFLIQIFFFAYERFFQFFLLLSACQTLYRTRRPTNYNFRHTISDYSFKLAIIGAVAVLWFFLVQFYLFIFFCFLLSCHTHIHTQFDRRIRRKFRHRLEVVQKIKKKKIESERHTQDFWHWNFIGCFAYCWLCAKYSNFANLFHSNFHVLFFLSFFLLTIFFSSSPSFRAHTSRNFSNFFFFEIFRVQKKTDKICTVRN